MDDNVFARLVGSEDEILILLTAFVETVEEITADFTTNSPYLANQIFESAWAGTNEAAADVLYGRLNERARDLARRIQLILDRAVKFDGADHLLDEKVYISNGHVEQEEHCFACPFMFRTCANDGSYGVLIVAGEVLAEGETPIRCGKESASIYVLSRPTSIKSAFRQAIRANPRKEADFFSLVSSAFPSLVIHPSVSFSRFTKSYNVILDDVVAHLSFLNDDFISLAKGCGWDIGSMMAKSKVDFSDESPNTKANNAAMKEREVFFGDEKITCTLHTKISKVSDRIHFHPPTKKNSSGVLIGIFADHLTT